MTDRPPILFADDSPACPPAIGDHARAGAALALNAAASLANGATDQAHRQHSAPAGLWPLGFTWSPLDPLRDLGRARDLIAFECSAEARRRRTPAPELPVARAQRLLCEAIGCEYRDTPVDTLAAVAAGHLANLRRELAEARAIAQPTQPGGDGG